MQTYYQEMQAYLNKTEQQRLQKEQLQLSQLFSRIELRLNRLYIDLTDDEGNVRYDYYKVSQMKAQAFKEIQSWLNEGSGVLLATLISLFVWSWNKQASYLVSLGLAKADWQPIEYEPNLIDELFAKATYEIEISGIYGQQALANSYNRLFVDVSSILDSIGSEGMTQKRSIDALGKAQKNFEFRQRRIYRTEEHRVSELANYLSAQHIAKQGYHVTKIWHNKQDDRVRDTDRADHVHLEKQEQPIDQPYLLIPSGTTQAPGNSGIAEQDINCRCWSEYKSK